VTTDTVGNLIWDADKSFTNYSSNGRLFNVTAHFTTLFQNPNDTAQDVPLAQGDKLSLSVVHGWLQGGVTQRDLVQYSASIQVPKQPAEGSNAKMGLSSLGGALALIILATGLFA
jgi:hypothetical protein